VIYLD